MMKKILVIGSGPEINSSVMAMAKEAEINIVLLDDVGPIVKSFKEKADMLNTSVPLLTYHESGPSPSGRERRRVRRQKERKNK